MELNTYIEQLVESIVKNVNGGEGRARHAVDAVLLRSNQTVSCNWNFHLVSGQQVG
jgi:hypothetical protein